MYPKWKMEFNRRMINFERNFAPKNGMVAVSIKIRVVSGCFHREHSPHAYEIIDNYLSSLPTEITDFSFEEHESGPEILTYVGLTTAGVALATSVINLIITIIKARIEGIEKGDSPHEPIELIIRKTTHKEEVKEETILRIGCHDIFDTEDIETKLREAASKLSENNLLKSTKMKSSKELSSGYEAVKKLAAKFPDWLPVVESALAVSRNCQGGSFAGSWVLHKAKEKGIDWFPNLKRLVTFGILERKELSRGGKRAYYSMPDSEGVEKALRELN